MRFGDRMKGILWYFCDRSVIGGNLAFGIG